MGVDTSAIRTSLTRLVGISRELEALSIGADGRVSPRLAGLSSDIRREVDVLERSITELEHDRAKFKRRARDRDSDE